MSRLRVRKPDQPVYELPLEADEFRIGRSSANDLKLDDRWLSRNHARLVRRGLRYQVEDEGSRNGTFVNDQPVSGPVPLVHGDEIRVGEVYITYLDDHAEAVELADAEQSGKPLSDATVRLDTSGLDLQRYVSVTPVEEQGPWPVLNEAAATLIEHYPTEKLVEVVLDLVFKAVPAERAALLLCEPGSPEDLKPVAQRGPGDGAPLRISRRLVQEVLRERQAVLTLDAASDERFNASESLQLQGVRSLMCVPLWHQDQVNGLIYADMRLAGRAFTSEDLRLLGLLANMAAVKLENARLVEAELEGRRLAEQLSLAAQIQRRLLPQTHPEPEGWELNAFNRSCEAVGGDTYDLLMRGERRLALVIADVAGKGVGAAILMAVFQASVRALAHSGADPSQLVGRLNNVLHQNSPSNKFVTAFYGELDLDNHRLEYVNAGHNPPMLVRDGAIIELKSTGPVLGVLPEMAYQSSSVQLEPGDLLCLFTDGVTERMDAEEREFGEEGLSEFLCQHSQAAVNELPELLEAQLEKFSHGAPPLDDTTLVLLRRL